MPRHATTEDMIEQEVSLDLNLTETHVSPIFPGVKVVYLGTEERRAIPLRGSVVRHETGEGDDKVTSKEFRPLFGMMYYDFSDLDVHGRKIMEPSHRMSETHPTTKVRGRPYQLIEAGEHLYWFARRPKEFFIIPTASTKAGIEEFIKRKERARAGKQKLVDETVAA